MRIYGNELRGRARSRNENLILDDFAFACRMEMVASGDKSSSPAADSAWRCCLLCSRLGLTEQIIFRVIKSGYLHTSPTHGRALRQISRGSVVRLATGDGYLPMSLSTTSLSLCSSIFRVISRRFSLAFVLLGTSDDKGTVKMALLDASGEEVVASGDSSGWDDALTVIMANNMNNIDGSIFDFFLFSVPWLFPR